MLFTHAYEEPGPRSVRVESEQDPAWDDIVEEFQTTDGQLQRHGFQVKLQTSPFDADDFARLLRALKASKRLTRGCFVVPGPVEVQGIGRLSMLKEMCRLASQPGCDPEEIHTPKEGQAWWRFLGTVEKSVAARLILLRRLDVDFAGDEAFVKAAINTRLKLLFREPIGPIAKSLMAFFDGLDHTRVVDAELLEREVLGPFHAQRLPTPLTVRAARARYLAEVRTSVEARVALGGLRTPIRVPLHEVRVRPREQIGPDDGSPRRPLREWLRAPWSERQKEPRLMVLIGEVGSGKTELLAQTAAELAADAEGAEKEPIPLLIDARALVDLGLDQAAQRRWSAATDALKLLMAAQTVSFLVLVDGLDEAGPRGRDALDALRRGLGERLHALVASTRPPRPSLPGAIEAWLPRWSTEEVEEFLVRWEAHDPRAVAALRHPRHRPMLAALCASPLTATLCLVAARENPEALRSRAGVYTEVIERLFDAWARERAPRIDGPRLMFRDVAPVLCRLALEVIRQERSTTRAADLRAALRREMPYDVVAAAEAVELDLGVLIRSGDDYDFAIRGIAEHLAGRELLERGDAAVAEASLEPWAAEACRHAIGWAALTEPGEPRRALRIIELLLRGEEEDDIVCTNNHLRAVLVATRAAADLGAAAAPIAEKLISACDTRLLDETSLWVGDRVADAVRELMHTGAPCWLPLAKLCFSLACDPRQDRAAWYAAQKWDDATAWIEVLHERDPEIRRVAVDRLACGVDDPDVRAWLALMTLDYGHRIGGSAPAVAAGLALRRAQRDEAFTETRHVLIANLEGGAQLTACAAAVALRPDEADPAALAMALRNGVDAFPFPSVIIKDLANTDEGHRELDRVWPTWKEVLAKGPRSPVPLQPCAGDSEPPASESVRARLVRVVAPALPREHLVRRVLDASYTVAPSVLCELAYDYPALVMPLLRPNPVERLRPIYDDAAHALGRAALRHASVRDGLIHLWTSIGPLSSLSDIQATSRQLYPGKALEPLIRRGDAEAAKAYAEWLPNAPDMIMPRTEPDPLAPEILALEPIASAAREITGRVWRHATEGWIANESTGERTFLMDTTAGCILHCLAPVWKDDASLRAGLEAWLLDGDDNRFLAALCALEGLDLPVATLEVVERGLRMQIESHAHEAEVLLRFVLPEVLRFIDRSGLAARFEPLLEQLARSQKTVACHAAALLITLRDDEQGAQLSREVSEGPWPNREFAMIDATLRHRMIALAPEAWARSLEEVIEHSFVPRATLLVPIVDGLPIHLKRRVLRAWARRVDATELPWAWDGSDMNNTARPADRVRQILFDLGFERDLEKTASSETECAI